MDNLIGTLDGFVKDLDYIEKYINDMVTDLKSIHINVIRLETGLAYKVDMLKEVMADDDA